MGAFTEITSTKNPQVLAAKALASRKGRLEQNAFLCEGEHLVREAVAMCPQAIQSVFVSREKQEAFHGLLRDLMEKAETASSIAWFSVPEGVMAALSQVKAPQGIAAVVALPALRTVEALCEAAGIHRLVLLENLQDPGNVGTLLRTLDAAGFDGCILAGDCADPFAPKTLRATMGSAFRVPLAEAKDGVSVLETLHRAGYATLAATLDGMPFYERGPLPEKLCLLIGNEGAGLSLAVSQGATHRYALPMRGGAESLNAAVAAAVLMYDLVNRT